MPTAAAGTCSAIWTIVFHCTSLNNRHCGTANRNEAHRMNLQGLQLLLLAGIAVFLIYRLKGVLGTRDGFEDRNPRRSVTIDQDEVEDASPPAARDADIARHVSPDSDAAAALLAMKSAESSFNVGEFLNGSRTAYKWIVDAYGKGEIEALTPYLEEAVLSTFRDNIEQRSSETNSTISCDEVLSSKISAAAFDQVSREAEITVDFMSRILVTVQDGDAEGQESDFVEQEDSWTFVRRMGQGDPNWKLAANS